VPEDTHRKTDRLQIHQQLLTNEYKHTKKLTENKSPTSDDYITERAPQTAPEENRRQRKHMEQSGSGAS